MAKRCKNCNGSGKVLQEGSGSEYGCSGYFEGSRYVTCPRCKGSGKEPGCLVSSAICEGMGKSDNCRELVELREFRDQYLMGLSWGRDLVEKYYEISPKIVEELVFRAQSDSTLFEDMYRNYLSEVLSAVREGNYEEAVSLYKRMMDSLDVSKS